MAHPVRSHGSNTMHVHLPAQGLMGVLFLGFGLLLILKKFGQDYLPFIPEEVIIWICAIGSLIGGFYLILTKIFRPRIYI
jgi:hypothetical protein